MALLVSFLLKALVILGVAKLLPGIRVANFATALGVAVVYAGLSLLLKWILVLLTLPMVLVTFGAFLLVINGFLLWMTDKLFKDFEIKSMPVLAVATVAITIGNVAVEHLVAKLF